MKNCNIKRKLIRTTRVYCGVLALLLERYERATQHLLKCIFVGIPTVKQGLVTPIPKPKLSWNNWRLVTLLCNDFELLAHVYLQQLDTSLKKIWLSSAFTKGINIHNHTRLSLDMLDDREHINAESCVCYFWISIRWLTALNNLFWWRLYFFGFGAKFCNTINMFHTDIISSLVSLNPDP